MIEIGQIIWLKVRFNKSGDVANKEHPLLVVDIDNINNVIEVAHLDHVDKDNYYHALLKYNHLIEKDNPPEDRRRWRSASLRNPRDKEGSPKGRNLR